MGKQKKLDLNFVPSINAKFNGILLDDSMKVMLTMFLEALGLFLFFLVEN